MTTKAMRISGLLSLTMATIVVADVGHNETLHSLTHSRDKMILFLIDGFRLAKHTPLSQHLLVMA